MDRPWQLILPSSACVIFQAAKGMCKLACSAIVHPLADQERNHILLLHYIYVYVYICIYITFLNN